ncbi:MAG: hypothetical protein H6718_34480 [Polyangiaceae bacterium]|nr:hypothetical protein [Polyangiaceae bacterium]
MGIRWAWGVAAMGVLAVGCAAGGDIEDKQPAGQGGTNSVGGASGSGGIAGSGAGGQGGTSGDGGTSGNGGASGNAGSSGASGAAGTGGSSGGTGGSSGASGSAGSGGLAGSAGSGGTGGVGGAGGTTGGTGGTTVANEALVAVGLAGSAVTRAIYRGTSWTSDTVAQNTESGVAVTAGKLGGMVVVREIGNKLRYMTVDTAGNWSSFADLSTGTTRGTPAAATTSNGTHRLVFHGEDFKYYSTNYSGGAWDGFANVGNPQAFGPLEVGIAARDAGFSITYKGDNTRLITQAFSGIWDPTGTDQGSTAIVANSPPAIAGRVADYVVVFERSSDRTLQWISGVNGTGWSAPQAVGGPANNQTFSVTATDAGDIVVAWVSLDDQSLYAGKLTGSSWSVAQVDSFGQQGSPALAPGVGGHDAELVFVRGSALQHSSLTGTTWSAPTAIASGAPQFAGLARMRW